MPKRTGAVHVATTKRIYGDKVYQTHLLRRTYREGGKVKHETLGNLSHLPAELIEIIRRSLLGEQFLPAAEAFAITRSWPHGHVEAVLGTIRKIGLDGLLAAKRCRARDLVVAMIAERLLHPASKLATTRLWEQTTLAEELEVAGADEDELYAALDWLLARQERIEHQLAARHLHEGAVVLYGVSSSYYEGHTCPLAQFGYNRDKKKGRPIIVYGLLADALGRPVAVDVYLGHTGDPTIVPDQVEKLRSRFGLERVVLVGDRGMLTQTRIARLGEHPGLGWISALKSGAIRRLVEGGALQLSLFDARHLAEISSLDFPGERLIACQNPLLAEERRRKREELLVATEKDLAKIAARVARRSKAPLSKAEIGLKVGQVVNRFKMAKHFRLTIAEGQFRYARKGEAIAREASLDGIYVIRTSEPAQRLSAEDTVRTYKGLSQVERVFRCLKGLDLRVRPIFHRVPERVRAHILLCMLAYYVEWHMRRALAPLLFEDEELEADRRSRDPVAPASSSHSVKQKKSRKTTSDGFPVHSFDSLLVALGTRCKNRCKISSQPNAPTFDQLTELTPLQRRAFDLLGL